MFSGRTPTISASAPVIVQGMLWKKGQSSMVTSWKFRRYELQENGQMVYFENTSAKGSMDLSDVFICDGPHENIVAVDKLNLKKRFPVNLKSQKDQRIMEVVFDSIDDLTLFVEGIMKLSMTSNVVVS